MAVRLQTARQAFLQATREFPRWMSIRKRPDKATTGLHLASIIDEQTDIAKELEKFISEFFLITYVGKESEIVDYVYIAQVGDIAIPDTTLIQPELELTIDAKLWLDNQYSYALYQDGYIIINSVHLPDSSVLFYEYNGYKYGTKLTRYHIWNIFDEFAMFLSLERFTDVGETNAELLKRCFLVFQNPANSTAQGLQNTIINCVSNDISVDREDIKIEVPNSENMWLQDDNYGTIYERLAQLNQDIFRTKAWDVNLWEHNFKKLAYLPHQWDKRLEVYQDGVGQMNDLAVSLSQDEEDTTNVTIRGFKKDEVAVNEYFHKQNIQKAIDLKLKRFSNVLKPQKIQFKITATPTVRVDPSNIYIKEQTVVNGLMDFYLEDIVTNTNSVTVVNPGALEDGKQYELELTSNGDYSDMAIRKINFVNTVDTVNLLKENTLFKFDSDGVLKYSSVLRHVTKVSELKDYTNIVDSQNGLTLNSGSNEGKFTVDVTGCGRQILKIDSFGEMYDLTSQTNLWTLNGLKLSDGNLYSDTNTADGGTATVELDCMGYTFTLKEDIIQGSVVVKIWINGKLNNLLSGTITTTEPITQLFDQLSHVKIEFTKSGEYPVTVKDIKATKYEINLSLSHGTLTYGSKSTVMPDIPNTQQNTLTVTVKSYDVSAPVIRYIHIGVSTTKAKYTVKNITGTNDSYLDIDTDCKIALYRIDGSARILVSDNYSTRKHYVNNTDDVAYLEISTHDFSQVNSSSKKISKTVRNGTTVSYIVLNPGEDLTRISITGTMFRDRVRKSIKDYLGIRDSMNVYIAKNAPGFILHDVNSGEETIGYITRDLFSDADVFTYENLPEGAVGFFCVNRDSNVITMANTTDRTFEDTFVSMADSDEYIAYNEVTMYKSVLGDEENVKIVNTFTPVLNMNQLMFYTLSDIKNSEGLTAYASFKKYRYSNSNYYGVPFKARQRIAQILEKLELGTTHSEILKELAELKNIYGINIEYSSALYNRLKDLLSNGYWSLGQKELYVTTDFDFNNSNSYGLSINNVNPTFSISNEITLDRNFTLNGEDVDIAEYIVEPPSGMTVIFGTIDDIIENGDTLIVNEDGFNKLKYSNVLDIQGLYVDSSEYSNYTLLKDEGIIIWNDVAEVAGKYFYIAYRYNVPTGLRYNDLSYLYDMISYTTDAYIPVDIANKIPTDLEDGDSFLVEFKEPVDHVSQPECTNTNFIAVYNNGTVTVQRVYSDNVAIVQAGYYYDNDKEYYFYNHDFYDMINKFSNLIFHNVKKLENVFIFMMASNNYLLNTDFLPGGNYEKLCYVDFNDNRVETSGISKLDIITACESYNMWSSFNMSLTFVEGINGLGMLFSPDDTVAYAVLNITKYLRPNTLVSLFATSGIQVSIYKEIFVNGYSMRKSVYAEPFGEFSKLDNFYGWHAPSEIDLNYRYYLVVRGNGVIDDIIIRDNADLLSHAELHVKNIDMLGFNFTEVESAGLRHSLAFNPDGCNLDGLEITRDNTIQIGTNVDYGLTKIWEMQDDYDNCTASESVTRRKNTFITGDTNGWVRTPLFYIRNSLSASEIYVKINNLMVDQMKNFTVTGYVADTANGLVRSVGKIQKTNLASFIGSQVGQYMQFEITAERNRIIDSIEVYAKYAESNLAPLKIENNYSGSITTEVYDTGSINNYKLVKVNGTIEHPEYFRLYIRGCKKDATNIVWTDWYPVVLDNKLETTGYSHVFENYRLFQFKIDFNSQHVKANITDFVLEVV